MTKKRAPADSFTAPMTIHFSPAAIDGLVSSIVHAVGPRIDQSVKAALADFMSRMQAAPAAPAGSAQTLGVDECEGNRERALAELLRLPDRALVSPREASLIVGLSVQTMKSKRRFDSFPQAVRLGHRTIKWRMGALRAFLREKEGVK